MSDNPFQYDGEMPDEFAEEIEQEAESKHKNLITDEPVTSTVSGRIQDILHNEVVVEGEGHFKIDPDMSPKLKLNQYYTIHFDPKSRYGVSVE